MNDGEIRNLIFLTVKYLSGDKSEEAEDAYFELDRLCAYNPEVGWSLIIEVSGQLTHPGDRASLGAGLLESFIRMHGESHAELIAEGIIGSTSLLEALEMVNEVVIHSRLKAKLPVGRA